MKAKVQASRNNVMVIAFFNSKGFVYTNIVPKGVLVNSNFIVDALGKFMKIFKKKLPQLAESEWCFDWDNAPVHTATKVRDWMTANAVHVLEQPLILT